jgi:deoxyribonuclease V
LLAKLLIPKAREIQQRLAARVKEEDDFPFPPQLVCGLDASYIGETAIGVAVLLRYRDMKVIDQAVISCKIKIPYIPTYFSFREYPPLSLAFTSIKRIPDVCFVDAHGRSHPRRCGAACHFGILRNIPTIGVAKRILCGHTQPTLNSWSPLIHEEEIVGAEITTKVRTKPIYVSVGHRIKLETAIDLTRNCTTKYRLPEPIRCAHKLASDYRKKLMSEVSEVVS